MYAGGISLILPDVQFGTVSQDWVTLEIFLCLKSRLKSIMLQNLLIMLSGISFFLPITPKIMITAPIILQIILRYLHIIIL